MVRPCVALDRREAQGMASERWGSCSISALSAKEASVLAEGAASACALEAAHKELEHRREALVDALLHTELVLSLEDHEAMNGCAQRTDGMDVIHTGYAELIEH